MSYKYNIVGSEAYMEKMKRKPDWLKRNIAGNKLAAKTIQIIEKYNLNTVCDNARCPNKGECYNEGTATFLALGNICTRKCRFCAIDENTALIQPPDENEPRNIAEAANLLNLDYLVVTMVTRDDLPDGGAEHIAAIIRTVRAECKPDLLIEVLTSDFKGEPKHIKTIADAMPDVFNHNVETISRLYSEVRPQAGYRRSLDVLALMREYVPTIITKSGLMVGLGENEEEVNELMDDLRAVDVNMLTIGQYLSPSEAHYQVKEYVHPDTFAKYRQIALEKGFLECVSGPYVRSSYRASIARKHITPKAMSS